MRTKRLSIDSKILQRDIKNKRDGQCVVGTQVGKGQRRCLFGGGATAKDDHRSAPAVDFDGGLGTHSCGH